MFVWTVAAVMAALDAGIPEVVSLFNRAYTMAWTNGIAISVARFEGEMVAIPVHSAKGAYEMAFVQTAATLNALEAMDMGNFDEEGTYTDFALDAWVLVTEETPDNFGIERFPLPMFYTVIPA